MSSPLFVISGFVLAGLTICGSLAYLWALRRRNMHLWLPAYYLTSRPRAKNIDGLEPVDVFIAVCDHYEPEWGRPSRATSIARVQRWVDDYPRLFGDLRDSSGRPPQHTYFFPQDEYQPEYLDLLSELVESGYGDVDIHLHHDADTAETLSHKLNDFKHVLFERHGLLRKDPLTGEIVYGFIHGNWALCNSRPDRKWCGVDQELTVLMQTGCYADFTLPSAPMNTQTQIVNSIYYARDLPGRCKSHDWGTPARVGVPAPANQLLMVQGALVPDWRNRKYGIFPRVENSDLHSGFAPTWKRFRDWTKAGIHVTGRPDWLFVKLHTHGCKTGNIDMLLGAETQQFHRELAEHAESNPNFRYHYVTAWEMAQIIHLAEQGIRTPQFASSVSSLKASC